jgi:hypothetical protein
VDVLPAERLTAQSSVALSVLGYPLFSEPKYFAS